MKTTVEITEDLFLSAKSVARDEGTTLRALIEDGLRKVLAERAEEPGAFRLEDGSVDGEGLQEGIEEGSWNQIRSLIYEGRGG